MAKAGPCGLVCFWLCFLLPFPAPIDKCVRSERYFLWLACPSLLIFSTVEANGRWSWLCHVRHSPKKRTDRRYMTVVGLVMLGWVLYHINHCRLFNEKACLYINILNIRFINTFCWYVFKWAWAHSFVHG